MAKLTMLASVLAKLDPQMKELFIGELSSLISAKTGGLDFKITEKDITKDIEPGDLNEDSEASPINRDEIFQKGLKTWSNNTLEGMKASGMNIQEM
jgi:hypothetical protein